MPSQAEALMMKRNAEMEPELVSKPGRFLCLFLTALFVSGFIIVGLSKGDLSFAINMEINDDDGSVLQYAASTHMDKDGIIYVAWTDQRSGFDIYFSRSTDGGETFLPNVKVNSLSGICVGNSIAVDANGTIFIAWDQYVNETHDLDVFFSYSTDGGMTFSSSIVVNDNVDGIDGGAEIAIHENDIYIVWVDGRSLDSDSEVYQDIYFAKSEDRGKSFGPNTRVNDDIGQAEQDAPSLAVDVEGNVYVAWDDHRENDVYSDVYFSRSNDGGATFTPNRQVSEESEHSLWPSIEANADGTVFLAWEIGIGRGIRFAKSANGGESFGVSKVVSPSIDAQFFSPDLAVEGENVVLAWEDTRNMIYPNHDSDIYLVSSENGGNSFSNSVRVNDDTGEAEQGGASVEVNTVGEIFVVWTDERNDYGDIYFARSISETPTTHTYEIDGQIRDHETSEAIASATISTSPGNYLTTADSEGRYALSLPNGSYILTVIAVGYQSTTASITVSGSGVTKDFYLKPLGSGGEGDATEEEQTWIPQVLVAFVVVMAVGTIVVIILVTLERRNPPSNN